MLLIVLLLKEHGNFYVPYRCVSQRTDIEISMLLIVLLLIATYNFLCSFLLYLSKEHGNFYVPCRCTTRRNLVISMFPIVVLLKGITKFLFSLSLFLSKEHESFHVRLNSVFVLVFSAISCRSYEVTLLTKHY